ncbi:MAG: hypothetical protein JWR50_3831 [Mucilaginibacter sp.]|nr:hypothetical protein [Mucilaginibacter sp.]
MEQDIIDHYKNNAQQASQEADKFKKLSNEYSFLRLGLFGLLIFAICIAVSIDSIVTAIIALVIAVAGFGWLVSAQNKFDIARNYSLDLKQVLENEITSIDSYANIYHNGSWFYNDKHFYTADLDIFGPNSLFQLINRSATLNGNMKLASWLTAPAKKETILPRQQAVKDLATKNDWKLEFQAHLLFSNKQDRNQIKNLIAYLKLPVELDDNTWLPIYTLAAPFILTAIVITGIFYTPALYFAVSVAFFNNRLVSSRKKIVDKTDLIAGRISTSLNHFALAFNSIEKATWDNEYCATLSARLTDQNSNTVSFKIKQLSKLIAKLNNRLNIVVKFILNVLLVWDIRQVIAIEKWKKNNHESFDIAFDVIAEFEALLSLSSLAINYNNWAFPQIEDGPAYTLVTQNMAHPLINSKNRVTNDYELTDTFKIDIITGSNMAGKSTFLRTIGINTVLALCGAPVCADSMRVSVMTMVSYMRIKDSLNESTSTFKAELDRLQMLLAAVEKEYKVFFLIDEMLRGTNSVDKYLGSKAVIQQLIAKKGVGMVATHDLEIAKLETAYPDYVRNFYFDIQVKDGEMLFDYKMKHGECKTFNATLLLKQIGINILTA